MDIYEPSSKTDATVVIVGGFRGEYNKLPFVRALGEKLAAAGLRAVAYANHDPLRNLQEVLARFERVALWASSGNGPVALSALTSGSPAAVRCAVLHYPYTFGAAEAATRYGFVDGCAGKTIDDLRRDVPIFISRAGRDQFAGLNESLDRFVSDAIARNMPITFVNHPNGAHAFDLAGDDTFAADIIRRSIDFATFHLNADR